MMQLFKIVIGRASNYRTGVIRRSVLLRPRLPQSGESERAVGIEIDVIGLFGISLLDPFIIAIREYETASLAKCRSK